MHAFEFDKIDEKCEGKSSALHRLKVFCVISTTLRRWRQWYGMSLCWIYDVLETRNCKLKMEHRENERKSSPTMESLKAMKCSVLSKTNFQNILRQPHTRRFFLFLNLLALHVAYAVTAWCTSDGYSILRRRKRATRREFCRLNAFCCLFCNLLKSQTKREKLQIERRKRPYIFKLIFPIRSFRHRLPRN